MHPHLHKPLIAFLTFTLWCCTLSAQKGKDGAETFASGVSILNRYAVLAAPVSSGATAVQVTNIADLNGSTTFPNSVNSFATNSLAFGDIILLIQVQGADINLSDNASYGTITALNNTGNYELAQVLSVAGNQVNLCSPVSKNYSQGGRRRTQVIRVPRLTTLAVNAGATVSGKSWDGTTGGIIAIEASGNITVNGAVSADTLGFLGGIDVNVAGAPSLTTNISFFTRANTDSSAGKGESIAGGEADYQLLSGAYGRGAPANGGGGGNSHNAGGGGGSNAGSNGLLLPYNGSGIKDTAGLWFNAWNLEAPGFALDSSVGGGRGGYTYATSDRNAITEGPGLAVWAGDGRDNVGGWGGHPLDYAGGGVLFLGGGGGAGDGNNNAWGNGGRGGGIIFLLTNGTVGGTGTISSNGQNGFNSRNFHNDAAGGAGAGGAIKILAQGSVDNISLSANGGNGGVQLIVGAEFEGPGGGGGGGYIETTTTSVTRLVNGGVSGTTTSSSVAEFIPNGATKGAPGTIASASFADVAAGCVLPLNLLDFGALKNAASVSLKWSTSAEVNVSRFEVERSSNSANWTSIATVPARNASGVAYYTAEDKSPASGKNFYRLKMIDKDGTFTYSKIIKIDFSQSVALRVYPNPIEGNALYIESKNIIQDLQLINAGGQILIQSKPAANSLVLKLPALSPGVYQLKIISNNETITRKLVKTN